MAGDEVAEVQPQEDSFYTGLEEGYPIILPPATLCEGCEDAFSQSTVDEVYYFKPEQAKAGCGICSIVMSQSDGVAMINHGYDNMELTWKTEDWNRGTSWIIKTKSPLMRFGPPSSDGETTADAIPLCKLWLRKCTNSHSSCNSPRNYQLPTRLICISGDRVYLTNSESLNTPKYATLSHCWGKLKFERLTKSNLSSFQAQILPSALPKSFQHAIEITRYLGLEYLWIDSLCIIQDDLEDWAKEASLMASVYSGSHVNLAASSASDASVGFFFAKESPANTYFQAKLNGENCFYILDSENATTTIATAPLSKRGWALQERFLPPRTIFFTRRKIFWKCHELFTSEIDPQGVGDIWEWNFNFFFFGLKEGKQQNWLGGWSSVIEEYTRCQLTKKGDTLVAISGIAKLFEAELQDDYVAGMWRKGLEFQLCWHRHVAQESTEEYVAPSWSWASNAKSVTYKTPLQGVKPLPNPVRIEYLDIQYETSDPFGQIKNAYLQISCVDFVMVRVEEVNLEFENFHDGWCEFEKGERLDAFLYFDALKFKIKPKAYILPLTMLGVYMGGLMLQPTGTKSGQYKRIGFFAVSVRDVEGFGVALQNNSGQIAREGYVSASAANGRKRYLIEII